MKIILAEDIVSVTDFARGTKEHLADMAKKQRPRVLTQNGKATAVVLTVDAFDELSHQAEEHRLDMELKAALEAYAKGDRGTPGEAAFARIRKKLGLKRVVE